MKDIDGSIPVADSSDELDEASKEYEMAIEEAIMQTVKEDIEEEKKDDDSPDWDGSESSFVEDDDAEEYEEKYSGVKLSYAISKDEIISCLRHNGSYRFSNVRFIVETIIFVVLAIVFFILFGLTNNSLNLIAGFISIGIIIAIALIPTIFIRINADKLTSRKKLDVEIFPDEISVNGGNSQWKIKLDGSCKFEEFNDMMLIYLPEDRIFIIPIRAIDPDYIADVNGMIVAGTSPVEEE